MTAITEEKMLKLQKNLPIIRNLAGWTAEDLGDQIGVTRQTITNIEKSESLALTKAQYIAIRSVLDFEIKEKHDDVVNNALLVLVDADNLSKSQELEVQEALETIASKKSRRINDVVVKEIVVAMLAAVGAIGGLVLAGNKGIDLSIPTWLTDLMKKE